MKQLNVRVEEEKLKKFKIKLLENNINIQEFINNAIDEYLNDENENLKTNNFNLKFMGGSREAGGTNQIYD